MDRPDSIASLLGCGCILGILAGLTALLLGVLSGMLGTVR